MSTPRTLPSPESAMPAASAQVAYVMNGFPRLSETFIAHEIHQLERLGLGLRLFSVKREHEPMVHPVVAAIRAPLTYLPKASSLSGTSLGGWLLDNLPTFWRAHAHVAARHPLRWAGALGSALALAWHHRGPDHRGQTRLRKVFVKEFLQAGQIAADVLRAGDVAHLHGHFCHGVTTITWLASRMSGIPFSFTAHAKDIYQAELNPGRLLERKLDGGALRSHLHLCQCRGAARQAFAALRCAHHLPRAGHRLLRAGPQARGAGSAAADPVGGPLRREEGLRPPDRGLRAAARQGRAFNCLIVGERGSAYEGMKRLIERRGLAEQVRLKSAVTQDEPARHLCPRPRLCAALPGDGRR
jgi:hypothetical protein